MLVVLGMPWLVWWMLLVLACVPIYRIVADLAHIWLVEGRRAGDHRTHHSGIRLLLQQRREFFEHRYSSGAFQRHRNLGKTFVTNFLGATTVHTIDTDNIRTITTYNFHDWGKSGWAAISKYCLGDGILLNDGESWKRSRALLKPVFVALQSLQLGTILEKHTRSCFREVQELNGNEFSFHKLSSALLMQVISDILWEESALWEDPSAVDDQQAFLGYVSSLEGISAACFNLGIGALPELLTQAATAYICVTGMRRFFRERIARACNLSPPDHSNKPANECIARTLMNSQMPCKALEGELRNLFFASFDTTSALLSNLIGVIGSRGDIQDLLRSELAFLEGRIPKQADIAKCQYLRFTVLETMRLFTPVTYHCRQAKTDTVLPSGGGSDGTSPLSVAKGTAVVWSIYSLNRDPKIWGTDSEAFRPDRWQNAPAHEYFMPFGSGPRQCPGQAIAQYMVSYITVRLLQSFDNITHVGDEVVEEALAVSFFDRHGTRLSIR